MTSWAVLRAPPAPPAPEPPLSILLRSFITVYTVNSGGNLEFAENDEFSEIWPIKGLKTAFSSANGGWGRDCRKFESFVGNL